MDDLMGYIKKLQNEGLFRDYSNDHFLIKAMNGNFDFFNRYPYMAQQSFNILEGVNYSHTFLINLSLRLANLAKKFSEDDIKEFVKNQLAAGKANYSEDQFFRALSEINVLSFITNFVKGFESANYEPRLTSTDSNPEARIKLHGGIILDIEVKTPGFGNGYQCPDKKIGMIKPNVVLPNRKMEVIKKYCNNNDLELVMPRVLKLKDFIESASKKFINPTSSKHFNLLFINWTFTDFPECGMDEPVSILANPICGILYSDKASSLINIDRKSLDKISAIILYQDTIDSILQSDFRYHFGHKTFRLLLNHKNNTDLDFELLSKLLNMKPYNDGVTITWAPADFMLKNSVPDAIAINAIKYIENVLWSSDEFLSELCTDVQRLRSELGNKVNVSETFKRVYRFRY